MSDWSDVPSLLHTKFRTLSMGVKLIVVCFLALLMMIPAFLVESLIQDRKIREADVVKQISQYVGGEQTFLGPILAVPYSSPADLPTKPAKRGVYLIFPTQASATVKTTTEERRRSLFKVPVFHADLKLDSTFDLSGVPDAFSGADLDWSRAEILVGVSDARGALTDATLTEGDKTFALTPAESAPNLLFANNQHSQLRLTLFGAHVADLAAPNAQFSVSSMLHFSGAQRIAVLAWGKTTHVTAQGDWPSPGFDGGFLPVSRTVTQSGFTADWTVPFIARGVRAEGAANSITGFDATAMGVSFVEVASPYQSVNRSLKYIPLFLGLVFLSYFIFEVTTRRRVHPAQYILVGMAQIIFYLLLLSFAERIGFDLGFLIAGIASVGLLSINAGWIFASRRQGFRALVVFALLYLLIYLLLRLEDNALLVGALASFAAVAAAMYFTRNINWYGSLPERATSSVGASNAE
ncbi:MAG TPA: cell envelope integrity protein CreD [Acidobacteriaceae bacterium]|nr:cell envelope integrity protein CreD [Acidobacteriaceae bacterium]